MPETESLVDAWQSLEQHWLIPTTGQELPRTPSYGFLRMFLSPLLRPMLNAKMNGLHNIPRKGPVILAANHLSHVDPIFVIAFLTLLVVLYALNYSQLRKEVYLDAIISEKTKEANTSDLSFADRLGDLAPFIKIKI